MRIKDEFETEWVDLIGELDLPIEAGQEILNLHRKQYDQLTQTIKDEPWTSNCTTR